MLPRVTFLLLLVLALPCAAAKWHVVALHTSAGSTVSVDNASLDTKDYIVSGWVRIDYDAPRLRDGQNLTGYVAQWQANCQEHTYWTADSFGNRPKGMESIRLYGADQEWQSPMPGSDESIALAAMCEETKSYIDKGLDAVDKVMEKAGNLF